MRMKKKRLFGIVFTLALAMGLMFAMSMTAYAEGDHIHDNITFTEWTDALAEQQNPGRNASDSLPSQAGNYYLTKDVTLDNSWDPYQVTINLCLNGHKISYDQNVMCGSNLIRLSEGATLNLYDKADNSGMITGAKESAVRIEAGTFNMYGGTIKGNTAETGAGVYVYSASEDAKGTFNMYGGVICDNRAKIGGGVCVYDLSSFNMTGGSITGNEAYAETLSEDQKHGGLGGGVYVENSGTLSMSDTTSITKNKAEVAGGGVYVKGGWSYSGQKPGNLNLSGASTVKDNTDTNDTPSASNVFLGTDLEKPRNSEYDAKVTITDELTGSDPIGVAMEATGTFTSGWESKMSGKKASDFFVSDDASYVVKAGTKELELTDAPKDPVSYLDWDEQTQALVEKTGEDAQRYYTVVTSSEDEWTTVEWKSGWYVVPKNQTLTINGTIFYTGDVHLILCDGATLNAKQTIVSDSNPDSPSSLTIYAQSEGTQTGKLTLDSAIGGGNGTITINGGDIKATDQNVAIFTNASDENDKGDITIRGGKVEANADMGGISISKGNITICGGEVTANGRSGIYAGDGNITITGGTVTASATDENGIYAQSGVVTISGGEVTASTDGSDEFDCGIYAGENNLVIGKGITVEAGDNQAGATDVTDTFAATHNQKWVHTQIKKEITKYPLWVGGVQVTEANASDVLGDGKVSYTPAVEDDPATTDKDESAPATLTLSGANITTGHDLNISGSVYSGGIFYQGSTPLTIELASGTNNTIGIDGEMEKYGYGVCCIPEDGMQKINLTITGAGSLKAKGDYGGITATGSITINNGTVEAEGVGIGARGISATDSVIINGGTVIATGGGEAVGIGGGKDATDHGTLTLGNGMYLYGGDTANPTTNIPKESGDYARYKYMTVNNVVPHTHEFTYAASGATITVTCANKDGNCPFPKVEGKNTATLTIAAPDSLTYDGTEKAAKITDEYKIQGNAKVMYQKKTGDIYGEATDTAPTDAGDYKASITLGEGEVAKTASVEYTIAQATPTITADPTASAITYGQKLENSTLTGGTASVEGSFAWKDSAVAPAVSDSQTTEYDVVFTPTNGNYTKAECKVKLAVNMADSSVTKAPEAKELTYDGSEQELVAEGTATGGTMNYALGKDDKTAPAEGWNASVPSGTDIGTYYVWYKAVGDDNHKDTDPQCVTVKIQADKTELNDAITAAKEYYDTIKGEERYSEIASELENAIKDAEAVSKDSDASLAEVDAALKAIKQAKADAEASKEAEDDANAFVESFKKLPDKVVITASNKEEVRTLLKTYDELTDLAKDNVDTQIERTGVKELADLEKALEITDRIDKLQTLEPIDAGDADAIDLARTAYEPLTQAQKAMIASETLDKLTKAETDLADAKAKDDLQAAKAAAVGRLEDYAAAKALTDFSRDEQNAYEDAVAAEAGKINAADKDAVTAALTAGKTVVDETLAQIEKDRADAAKTATADYAANKAMTDANKAAEKAGAAAEAAAKDQYASSADQKAINEAQAAVEAAQKAALELPATATAAEKQAAAKAIEDAVKALNEATDAAIVNSATVRAKAEAEAKQTKELSDVKATALDRLEDFSEVKALPDFSKAEKKAYGQAVAKGQSAINAAASKDAVDAALKQAKKNVNAALDKIKKDRAEAKAKKVKTVTVNVATVNAKAVDKAVKKAGGKAKYVKAIILGKNVKKIKAKAFTKYKKAKTLQVKTTRLNMKSVKNSLRGSKVTTIKVKVGSKKANKKYVMKYKKIFTAKNAGKKVKVAA